VASSIAHFFNDVSVILLPAVLPLVIEEFKLNYAEAGLAITSLVILMNLSQVLAGYIADRVNKLLLLFVGLLTLGLATLLVGLSTDYVQLLIFQGLLGIGGSFYHPVGYSLLSDSRKVKGMGRILGLVSAAGDTAAPVAFLASGFLAPTFGWRTVFIFWSFAVFSAAFVVLFATGIRYERKEEEVHANKPVKETIVGLIPVMITMFLAAASYRVISSFATSYLTSLGLKIEFANLVVAFMMIMGIVGALVSGFLIDNFGERFTILSSCLMLTLTSTVVMFVDEIYLVVPVICVMGFPLLEFWPAFYSHIAKSTSKSSMALVYGTIFALTWGGGALFPYIGGAIADFFGLKSIYTLVAVLSFISIIVTLRLKLENDKKTRNGAILGSQKR